MRKKIINIIGIALFVASVVSCDTAVQDPSAIVAPDDSYPTVTFTPGVTSVAEGDTAVLFTITLNKAIERSLTFTPVITTGAADADHEYILGNATISPWETETEVLIIGIEDVLVEETVNVSGTFLITSLAEKYLVQPGTTFPSFDATVTNSNDPTLLTINFAWDTDEDHDIVTFSANDGAWGNGGAGSGNPEVDQSIWLSDDPGDYYVNLIEWGNGSMNWTATLGHPDGTNQTITGVYDATDVSGYIVDAWVQWGNPDTYRLLKVANSGTDFTVTKY